MRVLVTGGSGFLGHSVVPRLVADGHDVVALARSRTAAGQVADLGATPLAGDLDDPAGLDAAVASAKADVLVNLASLGFGHAPAIVSAAEEAGIERAVFVSTTALFTTLPAASKAVRTAAEATITASGLAWTIVRPTMIYGARGDRNMERLVALVRRSPVVPLPGGGRRLIQPVHVDDLAWFVVRALEDDAAHHAFDVAGPDPIPLRDVVAQTGRAAGRRPIPVPVPLGPAIAAVRAYERVAPRPRLKVEQLQRLDEDKAFPIDDAVALGYRPRSFADGIGAEARALRTANRLGRYARTVSHLRPEQVAHRVRLRAQAAMDRRHPPRRPPAPRTPPGWPGGFRSLEADLDHGDPTAIAAGTFTFLDDERALGWPADWDQAGASHLWRFHLHYVEWAWALAQVGDRDGFARLWRSWTAAIRPGHPDAWAPYVASLRAWVLCDVSDVLVAGTGLEGEVGVALEAHAAFLERRLELDAGGNHLVKNLKALVGLGVFLGSPTRIDRARELLARQLPVQVLADGGHFERSPSYHCQVLGDLLDIQGLLAAAGERPVGGLDDAIGRMQRWLGAMVGDGGDVPILNDGAPVGAARVARLGPVATADRLVVLEESGYVVVRPDGRSRAVLDVGDPCPDELPAHAHADCLSFVLDVDGSAVIADTGTSTYEPGERRAYERSTAAHNTVEVDGQDQTEVWGAFRAGHRARGLLERAVDDGTTVTVVASHDGYRRLPGSPVHRRTWELTPGRLLVHDEVSGGGHHEVVSRLHLPTSGRQAVTITATGNGAPGDGVTERPCRLADGFGSTRPGTEVADSATGTLPLATGWELTW